MYLYNEKECYVLSLKSFIVQNNEFIPSIVFKYKNDDTLYTVNKHTFESEFVIIF